jgi:hypothetical protein
MYTFVVTFMEERIMSKPKLSSRLKCLEHLCVLDIAFDAYYKLRSPRSQVPFSYLRHSLFSVNYQPVP